MKELIAIQSELKAPKNQRNNFGGYQYRSAEDILEALKPLLNKYNCYLTLSDELVNIGDRYYIKATATIYSEKTSVSVTAYAREEESKKGMDGSQVTGASSSYARKYALNWLFALDDTKDSDATNTHGKEEAKSLQIWKQEIDNCKSLDELNSYYAKSQKLINDNKDIISLFSTKKLSFTIKQPIAWAN